MTDSFDKASEYAAELDDVVMPGALHADANIGLIVPLVVYTDGQREVIGSAKILGNTISVSIEGDCPELVKMIRRENSPYTAATFSFGDDPEILMINGDYLREIGKRV